MLRELGLTPPHTAIPPLFDRNELYLRRMSPETGAFASDCDKQAPPVVEIVRRPRQEQYGPLFVGPACAVAPGGSLSVSPASLHHHKTPNTRPAHTDPGSHRDPMLWVTMGGQGVLVPRRAASQ